MVKSKTFSTLDIYLVSFLSLHDVHPKLEDNNGKIVFTFDATDTVYRLMNRYNSNESVPVADLVTAIKTLRGKMLTAKESMWGNGKGFGYARNEKA